MKLNKLLFSLLLSYCIASCNSSINNTNYHLNTQTNLTNKYSISGSVSFPNKTTFVTKASLNDIAQNATVSLIYPNNHPTSPNKTISTGLTDASGSFTLFFDNSFNLNIQDVFILEATRRISSSSNKLMSVRTFVKWNGSSWDSITSSKIKINTHTTALCAITALIPTLVNPADTINTISIVDSNISANDIKKDNKVVVTSSNITDTAKLVDFLLLSNYDPIQYLAYKDNSFYLREPKVLSSYSTQILAGISTSGFSGDNVQATNTQLNYPRNIAFDGLGNLYIADTSNYRVRKVDKTTGIITTVAGNGVSGFSGDGGQATNARLNFPNDIAFDSNDNLYIADGDYYRSNFRVRKVDKTTGIITTVAGNGTSGSSGDGGQATNASIGASDITFDSLDNLYIAGGNKVRKVAKSTSVITTIVGNGNAGYSGDNGLATNAQLNSPKGLSFDSLGNLYITDSSRIRKVETSGIITTVAGNIFISYSDDGVLATNTRLNNTINIEIDSNDNLYITENIANSTNIKIRKVDKTTGIISTFATSENNSSATISNLPSGTLMVDKNRNIYILTSTQVLKVGTSFVTE